MYPVTVNGVEIPADAIAAELQYHPAPSREQAWRMAATALVIRRLLLNEAERLGNAPQGFAQSEASGEEEQIQALLAREIVVPEPDDVACRRYWSANPAKFRASDLYEAAHILFPAATDDGSAREAAKAAATETLALLRQDSSRFAALAQERSACPSRANGGRLGQQSRGDLVPEIESFIFALDPGQISPVPVATRYGYHVLRLDRLARGEPLAYESVAPAIARDLRARSWQRAVSQYLRILTGRAEIEGLAIDATDTPLVQ
jgi:peptidyl-prolyl cis-trans isomerase C